MSETPQGAANAFCRPPRGRRRRLPSVTPGVPLPAARIAACGLRRGGAKRALRALRPRQPAHARFPQFGDSECLAAFRKPVMDATGCLRCLHLKRSFPTTPTFGRVALGPLSTSCCRTPAQGAVKLTQIGTSCMRATTAAMNREIVLRRIDIQRISAGLANLTRARKTGRRRARRLKRLSTASISTSSWAMWASIPSIFAAIAYDEHLCKERHLIERFFIWRIATTTRKLRSRSRPCWPWSPRWLR